MDPYEAMNQKQTGGGTNTDGAAGDGQPAPAPAAPAVVQPNQDDTSNTIPIKKQDDGMRRVDGFDKPGDTSTGNMSIKPGAFNEEAFFTEKTGGKFKSWEEIQSQLSKGPEIIKEKEPMVFANESSKQFYEMVSAGNIDGTLPILQQRAFASKVKDLSPDELLVAHLRAQSPSLTEAQAKRQLERTYSFDDTGLTDEDKTIEQTLITDRKKRDAETAIQYFASNVPELKLPPVTQTAPEMSDSSKQVMNFGLEKSVAEVSKFPFEFAPANSPIKVQGQTSLPTEKVQKLSEQISKDPSAFVAGFINRWLDKDKNFDSTAIARDVAFFEEAGSMINTAVADAFNQFLTQRIAQEKNILGSNSNNGNGRMAAEVGAGETDVFEKFFHIPPARN